MKITADSFELIDRAEKLLNTSFMTIYDEENLEGYIDEYNLSCLVDGLLTKIKRLQIEIEDIEQDRDENYRPVSLAELYDMSDSDFI